MKKFLAWLLGTVNGVAIIYAIMLTFVFPSISNASPPTILRQGEKGIPSTYQATVHVMGSPGETKTIHVDNVARTARQLYENGGGTWLNGGSAPFGFFLSCESKDIRIAFGGSTASTTLGHKFPAEGSWIQPGIDWITYSSWHSASATDNVTCQFTPEY